MEAQEINHTKPTELTNIAMWVAMGDQGAIICQEQGPCKRPETDPTACRGCAVAWRQINGEVQYRYRPLHKEEDPA